MPDTETPHTMEMTCAQRGSVIESRKNEDGLDAKKLQTTVRNALGVLREEGVYALYLFLRYRWDEGGKVIWPELKALWREAALGSPMRDGEDRQAVIALTDDLQALLLAREVAERTLIYALYGLRAKG